jgi:hypothetical protein
MGKDGYSREGFFGEIIHYDSKGHKIGESWPSFFGGGYNNYDSKGHKTGETRPGFFGYNTYDNHGHKTGSSSLGLFGTNHYDSSGHRTGTSMPGFIGTKTYGNGDADLIGNASAAAAMERDPSFASWGSGGDSGRSESSFLHQSSVAQSSFQSRPVSAPTQKSQEKFSGERIQDLKTVSYIIARWPGEETNRYYLCQNETIKVGDMVKVSDIPEKIEVLAIVACDEATLTEMKITQKVLWK